MGEDIKIGKIEFGRSLNDSELKEIEYHAIEWGIPHQLKMVEEIRELKDKLSQAEGENDRMVRALEEIEKLLVTASIHSNPNIFFDLIQKAIEIARKAREGPRG